VSFGGIGTPPFVSVQCPCISDALGYIHLKVFSVGVITKSARTLGLPTSHDWAMHRPTIRL